MAGLFVFFLLVVAAFWIQKPIRTSRFLHAVGAGNLPWVKLGTAFLILPVALLYSQLTARYRREHIVYLCTAFFAAASVLFSWSFRGEAADWTHYVYFFYVDVFSSVMVGLFWSFANDLSSPEQARRDYGFIGAGGIIGGAIGSGVEGWTVESLGPANLLLICAALLLSVAALARWIVARGAARADDGNNAKPEASFRDAIAGARLTWQSRYLTCIAAIVVTYEIVSNLIDYQFNTFVAQRYPEEHALAAFLGQFSTVSIATSALVQFVVTTWILRRWGPRLGLLVLPIVLGLGSGSFLIVPTFGVIAATFFSDAALGYSLNQASKEVLYTPADEATKYQAKAFIDMFLMRFGKGISAVLILACTAWFSTSAVRQLALLSLVVVGVWLIVARAAGRQFAEQTQPGAEQKPNRGPDAIGVERRGRRFLKAGQLALMLLLFGGCAGLQRGGPPPRVPEQVPADVAALSDDEVQQRLDFLIDKLDARRDHGWYWYYGWTATYAAGTAVESARAATTSNKGARGEYIVGAVKALGGTANLLLRPLPAKDGADRVRELPGGTPEERRIQLVVAEEQLRANAREAEARYSWIRHLSNLAVNAVGAIIVWKAFDSSSRAWRSAGIGFAVGEAQILSAPWKPASDWEEYQKRFNTSGSRVSWRIVPTVGGAAFQVDF